MTVPRRSFLHAMSLGFVGIVAGCTGQANPQASRTSEDSTAASASATTADTSTKTPPETATNDCDTPPDTDEERASGSAVSTTQTVTDENVEYLAETDEVRYVARWRGVGPDEVEEGETPHREAEYETIPFAEWANVESATIAATHVRDVVGKSLSTEGLSFGVTSVGEKRVVVVDLSYTCNRARTVVSSPHESVTLDAVVDTAPATVDVSFTFEESSATRSVPVYVRRMTIHYN